MQAFFNFLTQKFSLVMIITLVIGICFQDLAAIANPCIKILLMSAIYLSLLKIDFIVLKKELQRPFLQLYIVIFTNFLLPIVLFLIMKPACFILHLDNQWAIGVLVLYGSSTASLSPALCILMKGHVERAVLNCLFSSLLVPFSLPLIIRLMNDASFQLNINSLMIDLIIMITVPLIATIFTKIFFDKLRQKSLPYIAPISVIILSIIVLGCVDGLTKVIINDPTKLLVGLIISYTMVFLSFTLGWLFAFKGSIQDRTTLAIFSAWPNVGLVIVISNLYFKETYPLILLFAVLSEIPWNTCFMPAQKFIQYMQSKYCEEEIKG